MLFRLWIFFLLSLAVWPAYSQAKERLVIEGTGDGQRLLRHLARVYQEKHPGVEIDVKDCIGSFGAIRAVARGGCSIAHISRKLLPPEENFKLNYRTFAYTPVVFTANLPTQCVTDLTTEEVLGIYSGKKRSWAQVGTCPDHKIYVANREQGDSSRLLLAHSHAEFSKVEPEVGQVVYTTPNTVTILNETPYTIAYLPLSAISEHDLTVFSVDGVAPVEENLVNKSYPYVMPLGFVWRGRLSELVLSFWSFIFSEEGAEIIRMHKSIPFSVLGEN